MKQLALDSNLISEAKKFKAEEFGGSLIKGRRKSKRPIAIKNPLHLTIHADIKKSGSLFNHHQFISATIAKFAMKFSVKIYEQAINSNHTHLVIKMKTRESYTSFIRALTGVLAKKLKIKWSFRPHTKIILWGRHFKKTCEYLIINILEAAGEIPYQSEKSHRKRRRMQLIAETNT